MLNHYSVETHPTVPGYSVMFNDRFYCGRHPDARTAWRHAYALAQKRFAHFSLAHDPICNHPIYQEELTDESL